MRNKSVLKHIMVPVAVSVIFAGVWFGGQYFFQQRLLSSGAAQAERVIEQITEGYDQDVRTELITFVGVPEEQAEEIKSLRIALINVEYVKNSVDITFIDDYVEQRGDESVYRAVYQIPAEMGTSDYVVVVFERADNDWVLANLVLSATNPLQDRQ